MLSDMFQFDAKIAVTLVAAVLKDGNMVSVHDGESFAIKRSTDARAILDAMGSTEWDTLTVRNSDGELLGKFTLIYGNGPGELVADYTANAFCESIVRRCGLAGY